MGPQPPADLGLCQLARKETGFFVAEGKPPAWKLHLGNEEDAFCRVRAPVMGEPPPLPGRPPASYPLGQQMGARAHRAGH